MFAVQIEPALTVPVSEGTVIEIIDGDGLNGRLVVLQNLDGANTLTYTWQKSPDRTSWSDVGTPNLTIAPGGTKAFLFETADLAHRLRASGNLTAALAILRFKASSGVLPLITL
jgi:hypothetical protein